MTRHPTSLTCHEPSRRSASNARTSLHHRTLRAGDGPLHLERLVVDREGMATEFLATLQTAERTVVTLLRSDQYHDLTSFTAVGTFVPLTTDHHGKLVCEVAPASIALPLPDHPGESMLLQVVQIRESLPLGAGGTLQRGRGSAIALGCRSGSARSTVVGRRLAGDSHACCSDHGQAHSDCHHRFPP
jgi:hypothetical protein